jgi:hypothetical protein
LREEGAKKSSEGSEQEAEVLMQLGILTDVLERVPLQ